MYFGKKYASLILRFTELFHNAGSLDLPVIGVLIHNLPQLC